MIYLFSSFFISKKINFNLNSIKFYYRINNLHSKNLVHNILNINPLVLLKKKKKKKLIKFEEAHGPSGPSNALKTGTGNLTVCWAIPLLHSQRGLSTTALE
jgi:hypothetical protein